MGERRTLGRFVCGERVTGGPLGDVHRARVYGDAGFEKDFALLLVDDALGRDASAMGRLVRAANCWARLSHPRIARAHELAAEGDQHYLVSDWVRGAPLSALVAAEGALPIEAALLVAIDVADAVLHAHARNDLVPGGILHLGLSMDTILVDGEGRLFVRDFGLLSARIAPGWAADDALVPALRYAAPELHTFESPPSPIDGRADVFSLGAVLFELLAGKPAFAADKARALVEEAELSPPSLAAIPAVAGPLVARTLAARAAGRLPSLGELRAQAESLLGDRANAGRAILVVRAQKLLPVEVARPSLLDAPAPEPRALRAPSLADDFFAAGPADAPDVAPVRQLPPPPSMLGAPAHWGGRPLLPPPTPVIWDPPSTTATTTLEALRRRRRQPLRTAGLVVLLGLAGVGAWLGWERLTQMRPGQLARIEGPAKPTPYAAKGAPAPPASTNSAPATGLPAGNAAAAANDAPNVAAPANAGPSAERASGTANPASVRITSTPAGARIFVDHHPAGITPAVLAPPPGEHTVEIVAEGYVLWRAALVPGTPVDAPLQTALIPEAILGHSGLKLVCRHPDAWRVIVDGVDTGRSCPVEERIPVYPGTHNLTLYAPSTGRTFARPIMVHDRGSSTRILLEDPAP